MMDSYESLMNHSYIKPSKVEEKTCAELLQACTEYSLQAQRISNSIDIVTLAKEGPFSIRIDDFVTARTLVREGARKGEVDYNNDVEFPQMHGGATCQHFMITMETGR
ncbi:hypothetical protein HPP92_018326 [Vanilla planifolia]|uniref:Uncharacterized protein n=1 Tax=Vanilla planifolia TaxID=51239 RepID=A0A835UPE0_VANPL|nr:hypothetical protein HPP92_018326 [Vanilla planifolia]